jgi:hypothetical protein
MASQFALDKTDEPSAAGLHDGPRSLATMFPENVTVAPLPGTGVPGSSIALARVAEPRLCPANPPVAAGET